MRTRYMRSTFQQALLGLSLLSAPSLHAASFIYEGRLDDGGAPAHGRYDIQLGVYDDAARGTRLGAPVVFPSVEVVDGRFRLDFDAPLEGVEPAWVEVAVRDAGAGRFSAIPGRAKATQAAAAIGACWSTAGDSGSHPLTHFLGTTDAQPLVLRTANVPSLRLEPSTVIAEGMPITANVIGGSRVNFALSPVHGATISGGGAPAGADPGVVTGPNLVTDHYGTIGGGAGNLAGDGSNVLNDNVHATVGGGAMNRAMGAGAIVAGGFDNTASAHGSSVSGGQNNIADAIYGVISGGVSNRASGFSGSVVGGGNNAASGAYAFVGGGTANCAGGQLSVALGSGAKVRLGSDSGAPGDGCTGVPQSGDFDGDSGTFVWADTQAAAFTSSGDNQFLVRAAGGVGINGAPLPDSANELSVFGTAAAGGFSNLFLRQIESDRGGMLVSAGAASSNSNNAGLYIDQFKPEGVNSGQVRRLELDNTGRLRVFVDNPIKPTAGSWSAPSDSRLKRNVAPLQDSLERLLALRGVSYEYRTDAPSGYFTPGIHAGFIAEEVQQVFPNWVSSDAKGYLMLGPQGFEALVVEALRELRDEGTLVDAGQAAEIRALRLRNEALENESAKLRASNAAIRRELAELRMLIQVPRENR